MFDRYILFVFLFIDIVVAGGSREQEGLIWDYLFIDQSSTYVVSIWCWRLLVLCLWSIAMFPFFLKLFVTILSLQTASPIFTNDGFIMEILTFLENQSFVLADRFGSFLVPFLIHCGWYWGYFVSFLGLLDRPNWVSRFALELCWVSFARFLLPTMAPGALMSFVISFGASWGRFRAPKLTLQPSKMLILLREFLHFYLKTLIFFI